MSTCWPGRETSRLSAVGDWGESVSLFDFLAYRSLLRFLLSNILMTGILEVKVSWKEVGFVTVYFFLLIPEMSSFVFFDPATDILVGSLVEVEGG